MEVQPILIILDQVLDQCIVGNLILGVGDNRVLLKSDIVLAMYF